MKDLVFEDLVTEHDYYCVTSSAYDLGFSTNFETFKHFLDTMGEMDEDMNLVFRYDIHQYKDEKTDEIFYYMEIFMVQQRKGKFVPYTIKNIYPSDFENIKKYLETKYKKIQNIWKPFSNTTK